MKYQEKDKSERKEKRKKGKHRKNKNSIRRETTAGGPRTILKKDAKIK